MAKTRLLLVIDEMEVGGSQRQIVEIATGLDPDRYAPEVLYFRNSSFMVQNLEAAGVPVHRIDKRARIDPGFLIRLLKFFRRERFDIVHAFSFTGEVWTALAMVLSRRPLLASIRGVYEWNSPLQWRAKRWVTKRAAATIANSSAGADFAAQAMNWPRDRIDVVYNGIDPELSDRVTVRERLDKEFGFDADVPLLVFVGRLVIDKNLMLLIDAVKRLQDQGVAFNALLVGDGPLRAEVEQAISRWQLSGRVRLAGQRSNARAIIAAGDVFVLCSRREGLSNVILEAMAEARPVVASGVGGNSELVEDGKTGILFKDDDIESLTRALAKLLNEPAVRERMGQAGRTRILQQFTTTRMIPTLEACYARALGGIA